MNMARIWIFSTSKKLSFLDHPQTNQGFKNLYLETDLGVVDIISEVTGVGDFKRVSARSVSVELFDFKCKVISIEDLIASKYRLGRPKDLNMVNELEELLMKKLND